MTHNFKAPRQQGVATIHELRALTLHTILGLRDTPLPEPVPCAQSIKTASLHISSLLHAEQIGLAISAICVYLNHRLHFWNGSRL